MTFVATPAAAIPQLAWEALAGGNGVVSDVGSVKEPICAGVEHPRFVGGHPMAGSEQAGIAGARADMFSGAVWVLTPGRATLDDTYAAVRAVVAEMGARGGHHATRSARRAGGGGVARATPHGGHA